MQSLRDALIEAGMGPALEKLAPAALESAPELEEPPACGRCRDAGYLRRDVQPGDPDFGRLISCSCEIGQTRVKRRQERIWSEAQVPPKMAGYTLDSLAKRGERQATLANTLREWQQANRWLVMTGPKGTCKTGGAVALLLEHIAEGGTGLYVPVPTFLARIRKTYRGDGEIDELDVLQTLIDVELLVLDDIGAAPLSPWGQEKLWTVVNERDLHHVDGSPRLTVVTTNLTVPTKDRRGGTLPKHLDDEGRTWDRIYGWAKDWIIETSGASQRGLDL